MKPGDATAIVTFCGEEVKRQQRGPIEVGYMFDAWVFMLGYQLCLFINPDIIEEMGKRVEPVINREGFRDYPVMIDNKVFPLLHRDDIVRAIGNICDAQNEGRISPQQLYLEFENVHPFGDGNGRVGKILYNWAKNSMLQPVMPKNPYGWRVP